VRSPDFVSNCPEAAVKQGDGKKARHSSAGVKSEEDASPEGTAPLHPHTLLAGINPLVEFLEQLEGTAFVKEDGSRGECKLLPRLSSDELAALSSRLLCPIPEDVEELLRFAGGFEGTWSEETTFAPTTGFFGFETIFPPAVELASEGAGNCWSSISPKIPDAGDRFSMPGRALQ
jgi:hypothetical protein